MAVARKELARQPLLGLQCKANTRSVICIGRQIFRGMSQYMTPLKPPLSVCCALFVSDMVQLRETAQEYGQINRVLLLGETHYSAIGHRDSAMHKEIQ